jgi:uncharacterized protein (DUF486 family)
MKIGLTIILLILSNAFMTIAWYSHLRFKEFSWWQNLGFISVILISWGIALFEYFFQVPANRIGYRGNNGPFSLIELKIIQEIISILVFVIFTVLVFKTEEWKWNHVAGFFCILLAVYFVFKK